jgi:DNA-binding NarL/FixJ family response regulator
MEQDPEIEVTCDTDDLNALLPRVEREPFDLILIDISEDESLATCTLQVQANAAGRTNLRAQAGTRTWRQTQAHSPASCSHGAPQALQSCLTLLSAARLTQRTVLMSAAFDLECLLQALCGNVAGYLIKDSSPRELIAAVHAIACGGVYIHSALKDGSARQLLRRCVSLKPIAPGSSPLSEREQDILDLLVKGYTNREISAELFLSPKTVESYRAKIYAKLGVRTRAALFSCAVEGGLVTL